MPAETPQFNPSERLPFGVKTPDTPEFQAAAAKLDQEMAAAQAERDRQAEMRKAVIISPEKAAKMRAGWEEEIKRSREKIKGMN